jgi:exodeoxyribonuclease-3
MGQMKLATWNVNSVRARQDRLLAWLASRQPDVLCLQELKTEESGFPFAEVKAAGYEVAMAGQKTYNGVAILSRTPITDVKRGLADGVDDQQARLIAGTVDGVRIISAYVPNGQAVGTDKYAYKLAWLARLRKYLDRYTNAGEPLALCGDFNVAPEERDVHDPLAWVGETLFHIDSRNALAKVVEFGLVDTLRLHHEGPGLFSWWDYRMLGFPKNRGLRIDQIWATRPLAERCVEASIDREERKGKLPSDHAPCLAVFR